MRYSIALAVLLSAAPLAVLADDWTYDATIYGWLPGVSGSLATPRGDLDLGSSGGSIDLDNLEMAFMGTFEARNGKWSILGDLLYTDLATQKETPFGVLFSSADVDVQVSALSGYLAYRVVDDPNVTVDLAAGFRAFGLDIGTTLNAGTLPSESASIGDGWVDPLVAARATWKFSEKWSASAFADFGGIGGSSQTWQALATANYNFNENWSGRFGYRYMDVEKSIDGRDIKIGLGGPMVGVTVRF
ncbi:MULTISPECIES: hypothetical protein [Falsihalocynthiibacter]|uniref:hypothetical protein n=1 Tax=Falsihalocynthiibacter TaxID=2854182 RepID=UPI003001408E